LGETEIKRESSESVKGEEVRSENIFVWKEEKFSV